MSIRITIIFTRIQGLLKADLGADLMDTKNTDKAMQSFLNSLHITHYLITKRINFSIPGNQGMVLSILDTAGPMTLTEISALLSMSKQQLTPTINKLISMNYILKKRKENEPY